ncbi:Cytochrome c/c1 hem-lyase [Naviculisporaceae sp. PSN 640]
MQTTDLLDTVLVGHVQTPSPSEPATPPSNQSPSKTGLAASRNSPKMTDSSNNSAGAGDEAKCPVDHKTREAWLQQARAAQEASGGSQQAPIPHPPIPTQQQQAQPQAQTSSWSSWLPRIPSPFSRQPQPPTDDKASPKPASPQSILDENRVISSIPRAPTSPADPAAARPSNHEIETGASESGKWIYPSEKMFFEAMRRKGNTSANPVDMKTVVPIHNAVNERAWQEILQWEAPYNAPASDASQKTDENGLRKDGKCGGPRLHSFAGLSTKMTPRARINTLLGYQAPFDRHDWVVDRCGKQVEYVIDFYAGRNDAESARGKLNFYLDVRPKLNTWEGVKMRFLKASGLV